MLLAFGETQSDAIVETTPATRSVEEIAAELRSRVLQCFTAAGEPIGVHELRTELGYPALDTDPDPQSNPVNRILKEMRDAGEIVCTEPDWGEPTFTLPTAEAADIKENEGAKRQLIEPPPLVRPNRQITYGDQPHYEWPDCKQLEDRDTITVDRITADIDGAAHRFVVRRGDTVEAYFRRDKQEIGEVVGISHAKQEVRVRFGDHGNGVWFAVGCIYPAVEPSPEQGTTAPLSQIAEQASHSPAGGFTDADRVASAPDSQGQGMESVAAQRRPFALADYRTFLERLDADEITIEELKAEFARLRQSHEEFVAGLQKERTADQLKRLAARFGCFDAKRNTKQKNAEHVYRVVLQGFTLSASVVFQPMQETLEQAVTRIVDGLSDEDLAQHIAERKKEREDHEQALSDPQTLDQFRLIVRERGLDGLSDEQRIRFDELSADATRAKRKAAKPTTVEQFSSDEIGNVQLTIKTGWHDRRKVDLWIVQMDQRVERSTFNELKRKASMLGGWYSSFKKADAGFQFTGEDVAQRFVSLSAGDADRSDVLESRNARKMESAAERLSCVAETLDTEATEILSSDDTRLKNTVRRSEMAAGMRGRAYAQQAMACTLRSVAAALDAGQAQYLDGLRATTQVETLIALLRRGKTNRNEILLKEKGELAMWDRYRESENLSNRPLAIADAAHAPFPYPSIYRRHLEELVAQAKNRKGLKQRSRSFDSHLVTDRERHYIEFVDQQDIANLIEYLARCRDVGLETRWVADGLEDYKRLLAAHIHTPQEMRCALRELVPHLVRKQEDDPVVKAEQNLVGKKIDGFFPTPKPVISRMLDLAEIAPGHRVLEPSAGKGDILDMLRTQHPDAAVTAVEINGTLFDVLEAKGHQVEREDFLEHHGEYDRVIMNPPFENSSDIKHVRHAFDQLAAAGRVVAVMSEGPFFRQDRKANEFRKWLDDLGGESEQLPDDAFRGVEAFRETGVRTRIVWVDKE